MVQGHCVQQEDWVVYNLGQELALHSNIGVRRACLSRLQAKLTILSSLCE